MVQMSFSFSLLTEMTEQYFSELLQILWYYYYISKSSYWFERKEILKNGVTFHECNEGRPKKKKTNEIASYTSFLDKIKTSSSEANNYEKNLHHTRDITPKRVTSGGVLFPKLSACATQLRKNVAAVANRRRHSVRLTGQGMDA